LAEKVDIQRRIEGSASKKDIGHPHKIVDVNAGAHGDSRINLFN